MVVSAAAGAIGSLFGQIAKAKGCRVIGFAGSDEKCKWLVDKLGFDKAINYKKGNLESLLKEAAPKGVDVYFDNVGGELSYMIWSQMNKFGRVHICGVISSIDDQRTKVLAGTAERLIGTNQLTVKAKHSYEYADRWIEGIEGMAKLIHEGKIKYHETVTLGFENSPKALIGMMGGENYGKAVVKF